MKKICIFILAAFWTISTSAQFQNGGFEQWSSNSFGSKIYPNGWNNLENDYSVQNTNPRTGNYALEVSVWYTYFKSEAIQIFPVNSRVSGYEGYYKYTDNVVKNLQNNQNVPDTAIAWMIMSKWNTATQKRDTIGVGKTSLFAASSYTPFNCVVQYFNNLIPDTATIVLDPSIVKRDTSANAITYITTNAQIATASYLTLDDIQINQTNSIENQNIEQLKIYPNPAEDYITISYGCALIKIVDMMGKNVLPIHEPLNNKINISQLGNGIYFAYYLDESNQIKVEKFYKK